MYNTVECKVVGYPHFTLSGYYLYIGNNDFWL